MEQISGIYEIVNTLNGHRYVGSSVDIQKRWYQHKYNLRRNVHSNPHLQSAWNKYGEENFNFSIMLTCERDYVLDYEQIALDTIEPEYNIAITVDAVMTGRKHSDETRQKMSESRLGENNSMYGKTMSEESRKKLSESHMGLYDGENNPMFGRTGEKSPHWGKRYDEETKAKWSELKRGEKNPQFGKPLSEEHKQKLSKSLSGENNPNFGKTASEETRRKQSEAAKARWAAKKEVFK